MVDLDQADGGCTNVKLFYDQRMAGQEKIREGTSMNLSASQRIRVTIILASIGTMALPSFGHAYTEEQQRLCSDDAMRLCPEDVPDIDRTTACMQRQRALLSKGCKSVFGKQRHFPARRAPDSRRQ